MENSIVNEGNPTINVYCIRDYSEVFIGEKIMKILVNLSTPTSKNLLMHTLINADYTDGFIGFNKNLIAREMNCDRNSIYNAIKELVDKEILLKTDNKNKYWINFNKIDINNIKFE